MHKAIISLTKEVNYSKRALTLSDSKGRQARVGRPLHHRGGRWAVGGSRRRRRIVVDADRAAAVVQVVLERPVDLDGGRDRSRHRVARRRPRTAEPVRQGRGRSGRGWSWKATLKESAPARCVGLHGGLPDLAASSEIKPSDCSMACPSKTLVSRDVSFFLPTTRSRHDTMFDTSLF